MRFHVDLGGKTGRRLRKILKELGWIESSRDRCDVLFSREADPFLPTVLVGKNDDIHDTVIDVIRGGEPEDVMRLKLRLYEAFLNVGGYMEYLEEEFVKSKRYSLPLSVAVFRVLDDDEDSMRCLVSALREYGRHSDKIFRMDDVDVLVVLTGTDAEGAEVFIRRITKRFVKDYLKLKILKEPDFVYGYSSLEDWMTSPEDLISSAEFDLLKKLR